MAEEGNEHLRICENYMKRLSHSDICRRIAQIRVEVAGPRGKSTFAKTLGISPSTYDYYESARVPPADVLVRIADVAAVDLRWLLTGEAAETAVPPSHPVVRRAAEMLSRYPRSAGPLAAFLDVLAASMEFPAKTSATRGKSADEAAAAFDIAEAKRSWLPVLGRSAAGVVQFWSEQDEAVGLTALDEMLARHSHRTPERTAPALAAGGGKTHDTAVQIITLNAPDESDVVEYIAATEMKTRHPDAFAVRIDGESMAPEIRHGDLVVLSPSASAADGRPAVVQLKRQIGLTCKIYRCQGRTIHLVPIHEQFAPQMFPADQVVWALRVLARVRPG